MARKLDPESARSNPLPGESLSNSQARGPDIINAMQEIYVLDCTIKRLTKQHIAPIRTSRSEILNRLRDDYQITAAMFRARYYAYRLEQEAIDGEDEPTQAAIRELFQLVPVGGQSSFLDMIAPEPELPSEPFAEAYNEGFGLAQAGKPLNGTKYRGKKNLQQREYYERGHADAVKQRAEAGPEEAPPADPAAQREGETYAEYLARSEQPLVPPVTPETEGLETEPAVH